MKKNIYRTTTVVTALSVAERALGFLYRIVLSRLIGAEGLGLYQVALSVFSVFVTIGTGGIPVTVSRLVTKGWAGQDKKSRHAALTAGIILSLCLTLPVCFIFPFLKGNLPFLFSDPRSKTVFGILLFGLILTCLYAVIRGSFWGNKNFLLTSILEIVEEAVMVIVGILLLGGVTQPFIGAKKAAVAVVVSYAVSFLSAAVCYFAQGGRLAAPKSTFKPLLSAAMPITAVRTGSSLIGSALAVILPVSFMKTGLSDVEAMTLLGVVSGMVMPVLSIPSTVIGSISLVLMPELSEAFYKGQRGVVLKNSERGLFAATMISCLLIPLFFVFGQDVGKLLYVNALAGELIARCSLILLPMSLSIISTSVLNSLNFEKQTLAFYFVGAAAMVAVAIFTPRFLGVYSYPLGVAASFVITSVLNLIFLHKKLRFSSSFMKKCLLCCATMLPVSLLGKALYFFLAPLSLAWVTIGVCAAAMLLINFFIYLAARLLPSVKTKKIFSK